MLVKLRRGLLVVALGLVTLFLLRLGYGYHQQPNGVPDGVDSDPLTPFELDKHNYASSKLRRSKGDTGVATTVDQKYERIAQTSMTSRDFAADEERTRTVVADHHGLVQFEERSGLEGRRRLQLAIGVDPERFDALVRGLTAIGHLTSIQIHKVDKTNDYRELQANRAALVTARDALTALKAQGGRVDELMALETSILEQEQRIQNLGVQLGEFDEENEFCTVKLTLSESAPAAAVHISFVHRAKVALEWTVRQYLRLLAIALVGALLTLAVLSLSIRFGVVQRLFALSGDDSSPGDPSSADAA